MDATTTEEEFSSIRTVPRSLPHHAKKNLRFFGDTDLDSNASLSKGTNPFKPKTRQSIPQSPLGRTKEYSQSAYELNTVPRKTKLRSTSEVTDSRHRSASLQNLENQQNIANGQRFNERYVCVLFLNINILKFIICILFRNHLSTFTIYLKVHLITKWNMTLH